MEHLPNSTSPISPNTQAILLLCSSLGKKKDNELKPLTPSEYKWLTQWLNMQQLQPADLLNLSHIKKIKHLEHKTLTPARLLALLMRGTALALAVDSWTNKGLWIISHYDSAYPQRLKTRLGTATAPLLYGMGTLSLLQKGGLAIIGSREADEQAIELTKKIAKIAAQQGITLISGGARGVDTEALLTAISQGRTAIAILPDSLDQATVRPKYREALKEERLVLLSPYSPESSFNVGNAMARNKYIYTLADWAVVITCTYQKGGTWAGAIENLKAGWVPLLTPQLPDPSNCNQELINQGAHGFDPAALSSDPPLLTQFHTILQSSNSLTPKFTPSFPPEPTQISNSDLLNDPPSPPQLAQNLPVDLFELIWPYLKQLLTTPKTEQELLQNFKHLEPKQLKNWLVQGLQSQKITLLSAKPSRYVIKDESRQPTLF